MSYRLHFGALVVFGILSVAGLPGNAQPVPSASQQVVPLIEPGKLHAFMLTGIRVHIVDVRQPEEFNQGHIEGAVLMPLGTLSESYTTLPKTGKLVVYCHSGRRSAQAVQFLLQHGYGNAVSLAGGYTAWTNAHF